MSNAKLIQQTFSEQANLRFLQAQEHLRKGQWQRAHSILTGLLRKHPQNGDIQLLLGQIYIHWEEFDEAILHLSNACQWLPNRYEPIVTLIDAFDKVNSHTDVLTLIDFMLSQFGHKPEIMYKAAHYLSELGQLTRATTLASNCLRVMHTEAQSNSVLVAYTWLLLVRTDKHICTLASVDELLLLLENDKANNPPETSQTEMVANYALGEMYHRLDLPTKAFACWRRANDIQYLTTNFTSQEMSAFFQRIKAAPIIEPRRPEKNLVGTYTQKQETSATITPIFIVGLPRTGSTLLEVLLSSHTAVSSLGEQALIANLVAGQLQQRYYADFPSIMHKINEQKEHASEYLQAAAEAYYNAIDKRQLSNQFVIDKLPANFQSIGLIKAVFPHAIIIHLTRAYDDVALSIYKHYFANNEPYFCNLNELSSYNKLYLDLMQHWLHHFGSDIYELEYEQLVRHPIDTMRALLQHCGLPFQLSCTHTNKSPSNQTETLSAIKTLSSVQVREAVSTASIGNAEPYQDFLKRSH